MIDGYNTEVIVRPPSADAEDQWGNPVESWTEEAHKALIGWGATGLDYSPERNTLTTKATIYFKKSVGVEDSTEFRINSKKWVLDGESITWNAPTGFSLVTGTVVQVKKVEG